MKMDTNPRSVESLEPLHGWVGLALVVTTLLVYGRVLAFEFVDFDDHSYVVQNRHVKGGLTGANIAWAFTTYSCGNWHPLTWLSLELDRDLYGGIKPGGYHFTNVVLHLANVVLVFHVLRRMTGAIWRSAFVAGLFALHPLHVESVAWVSERKDVLSTLFWLLTLWAYVGYVDRPGWRRYVLVLLALALGLMAKPMLVTLPFVLLLLDYWPLGRWDPRRNRQLGSRPTLSLPWLLVEKLPLLVLTLASCLVTLRAQAQSDAIRSLATLPLDVRLLNALQAYGSYLAKMVWPVNLAVWYLHQGVALSPAWGLAAGVLLLAITVAALVAVRQPYLAVGWFWYLGTLVPVIGLVQVGEQTTADRYTYVPSLGLFLALAWSCGDLAQAVGRRGMQVALSAAAVVILLACAVCTREQLGTWSNSANLWEHAIQVTGDEYIAHTYYGRVDLEANRLVEARQHFARAVELKPAYGPTWTLLGTTSLWLGDTDQAFKQLSVALSLNPNQSLVHYNLALTYLLGAEANLAAALNHCRRAVELDDNRAEALFLLGYLCHELDYAEEAAIRYREALQLAPNTPEAASEFALTAVQHPKPSSWQVSLALFSARMACQATDERRRDFLETLAVVEAAAGRPIAAVQALRKAIALLPEGAHDEHARLQQQLQSYEKRKQ
jgi:Tfp pilus assembly protein PilF